ncbi:hypothetical protein KY331_05120 [Candidatus Woesearchaeota archaeon]|nr:hypothetical protein [Candidatus Woesearchaeota archaeon]
MFKKRGQITVFIILGIILLLSAALFFFLRQEVSVFKPTVLVPPEIVPVNQFILDCVETISRDGANILGANGGFIDIPDEIETEANAYLPPFPISPVKTVLWFYRGQTRIPPLNYVILELETYVHDNLPICLQGFEPFNKTFNITELGDISVDIDLGEEDFRVDVNYPLDVILKAREQKFFLEDFSVKIPYRIKKMYELATQIIREEIRTKFIERRTIDLIAMDNDIPYTDMAFSCRSKTWQIKDVENKLKHLLYINLPRIAVDRTKYEPIPKKYPYEQNHYVWPITEEKYADTHVSFSYDESWPFELYIRPNEGRTLKSNANRGQDFLNVLCVQLWHFTYDVRYPVLVTLKDDATRKHDDYVFNIGFDVSINHNAPDKSNFASAIFSFETTAKEEEYCRETETNRLTVHTFENVSTQEAGDLTTEIDGVNISFTCIRMKCPIGQSEWQFRGAVSYVSEQVPQCANGVLRGEKPGYESREMFVTTNTEKSVDLYLTPVIEIPVTVVKHYEFSPAEPLELDEENSALITIKRGDFESDASYYSDAESPSTLKLLAKWNYNYNITIYLSDDVTIRGGYQGNWTADWEKLKYAKEIRFHVLERPYIDPERSPEQAIEVITKLDQLTQQYSIPEPEIIT